MELCTANKDLNRNALLDCVIKLIQWGGMIWQNKVARCRMNISAANRQ